MHACTYKPNANSVYFLSMFLEYSKIRGSSLYRKESIFLRYNICINSFSGLRVATVQYKNNL